MKPKKNILLIGPAKLSGCPVGGMVSYIETILKSNLAKDYNFLLLNTSKQLSVSNNFFLNILNSLKKITKLFYLLSVKNIDIVHINSSSYLGFFEKQLFALISKLYRKKVVFQIHGGKFNEFYNSSSKISKLAIRTLFKSNDKIIVVGRYWFNFLSKIVNTNKLEIVYNSVDPNKFKCSRKGRKRKNINVLSVGCLSKEKGTFDIINAIPIVIASKKNVSFNFIGRFENETVKKKLEYECQKSNIKKFVFLKGEIEHNKIKKEYCNSDIFILPSYYESFSLVLLEAMASGLPIITTNISALPELIKDNENGFLIEKGDYKKLAGYILELVNNKNLRNFMARKNISKIEEDFSLVKMQSEIRKIYDTIIPKSS